MKKVSYEKGQLTIRLVKKKVIQLTKILVNYLFKESSRVDKKGQLRRTNSSKFKKQNSTILLKIVISNRQTLKACFHVFFLKIQTFKIIFNVHDMDKCFKYYKLASAF